MVAYVTYSDSTFDSHYLRFCHTFKHPTHLVHWPTEWRTGKLLLVSWWCWTLLARGNSLLQLSQQLGR